MAPEAHAPAIGEVVSLVRGTTYKSALLEQPGPVLLGLASIQRNGGFRGDSLKTYGGESKPSQLLVPGDLYVSLKDVTQSADLLGAIARVPVSVSSGRLTQDTVKLDFGNSDYPRNLVYWALRTPQYRAYCRGHSTGTTNLGLPRDDFLAYRLPAPTSCTLSLVEALEALDDRIDNLRQTNATLEAIAAALFKSRFVDFDGVLPEDMKESELGLIPKGWRVASVGEYFNLTMGQSPPGNTYNETGEGIPFYQGRADFGARFPTERVYCTEPTRLAQKRDVLVSVRAPVGDMNVALSDCAIGRGVAAVRHECASFALYLLQSQRPAFKKFDSEGTVFGSISKKQFEALRFVAPPDETVREFQTAVQPMDERIENNARQITTLATLRDTLLPRLISGRLRVKQ